MSNGVCYDSSSVDGFTLPASGAFENDSAPGYGTGNNGGVSLNFEGCGVNLMLAAVMGAYDRGVAAANKPSCAALNRVMPKL